MMIKRLIFVSLFLPLFSVAQKYSAAELARFKNESKAVTIIRDKWGIPHIYGKTDANVVFGLMYAECQTDFSRVEKNYLEMLGRQAKAYGEAYLYTDVMMRLIYDSAQAVSDYEKSPAWMHKLLDAFADGVNYYLYKHPETKPLVLKHWEPWYALMFTDGSVSATSTGGVKLDEIKSFYSKNIGAVSARAHKASQLSAVERMVLADRGMVVEEQAGVQSGTGAAEVRGEAGDGARHEDGGIGVPAQEE